jgi:hypothetical protein
MNARDLITTLLEEMGEAKLARQIANKLRDNEEASLPVKMAGDDGTSFIREITVHFDTIILEQE